MGLLMGVGYWVEHWEQHRKAMTRDGEAAVAYVKDHYGLSEAFKPSYLPGLGGKPLIGKIQSQTVSKGKDKAGANGL